MKKIYNKLTLLSALAISMMFSTSLVSCGPDENDWGVDPSVIRQKAPLSLEAEIDDYSLDMTVTIGSIPGAKSYQIQVSKKPLLSGFDDTEGIPTFTTTEKEYVINRTAEELGEPITENTTYYLRVRAVDEKGQPSKWYTNGMNYNEGYITDPTLASLLKDNATYSVTSRAGLEIDDTGDNYIDLMWYMLPKSSSEAARAYCKAPLYIINETLQEAGEPEDVYKHTLTDEEKSNYKYEWANLEVKKSYTFALYDEENTRIGYVTESTEETPNMSLARNILSWTKDEVVGQQGVPLTLVDKDHGDFKIILNQDNAANSGYKSDGSYWCQTPLKEAYKSAYRFQSKNRNSMSFIAGQDGRLYVYSGNGTTYKIEYITSKYTDAEKTIPAKNEDGEEIQTIESGGTVTMRGAMEKVKIDGHDCYRVTKIRLRMDDPYKGKADEDGYYTKVITKITPTASASCYYYGFIFVPDETEGGE